MDMEVGIKSVDRELWRKDPDDAYSPSIHVTGNGLIGINVGGRVIVRSVNEIHRALIYEMEHRDPASE